MTQPGEHNLAKAEVAREEEEEDYPEAVRQVLTAFIDECGSYIMDRNLIVDVGKFRFGERRVVPQHGRHLRCRIHGESIQEPAERIH